MTERDLFRAIMYYEDFDRMPVYHWTAWPEWRRVWAMWGVPHDAERQAAFFGAYPLPRRVPANIGLMPAFEEQVIEESDEWRLMRDAAGVLMKHWKDKSCIPQYIEHSLKDRESWERDFLPRLQPGPARLTQETWDFVERCRGRDFPVAVTCGSMVGWLRNWMGVPGLAYLAADDPDLLGEMVDTLATLTVETLEPVVAKMDPKPDLGWFWEDICCKSGPLVSPRVFERYCVPGYRKITGMLRSYGVDLALVDCDGAIDALVPHWLAGDVNIMFPIEIGVWQADPMAFRRQYGRELRVFGGIDKRVLALGPAAIDAEIERRLPLMREGGFIPLPDHLIPPGVSLEDYRYYLARLGALRF